MNYCVIQDDDGHSFVVPHERKADAEGYLASICEEDDQSTSSPLPSYMKEIEGLHTLVFTDWKEVF